MKSRQYPAVRIPAAAVVLLGLVGCGTSVPDAGEKAESVAINGKITQHGKDMTVHVPGTLDGSNSLAQDQWMAIQNAEQFEDLST